MYVPPPDEFPGATHSERWRNYIESYITWEDPDLE